MNEEDTVEITSDIDAALIAGNTIGQLGAPKEIKLNGVPHVVKAKAYEVDSLEHLMERPVRLETKRSFFEPDSFIEYVNTFKDANSRLYATIGVGADFEVQAVLDDNEASAEGCAPRWQRHKAVLRLTPSEEWNVWFSKNRKAMDKVDFCDFITDRSCDILNPAQAELLSAVRHFTARRTTELKDIHREDGGYTVQTFDETKGTSEVQLPAEMVMSLRPFKIGEPVKVAAQLRFRFDGSNMYFFYGIPAMERIIEAAFSGVRANIEHETELKVFV